MARCIPSAENGDASVVCARKQVCHKALWEGYDMTADRAVSSGQPSPSPPQLTWLPRVGVYLRVSHNKGQQRFLKGKSTLNQEWQESGECRFDLWILKCDSQSTKKKGKCKKAPEDVIKRNSEERSQGYPRGHKSSFLMSALLQNQVWVLLF